MEKDQLNDWIAVMASEGWTKLSPVEKRMLEKALLELKALRAVKVEAQS